MEITGIIILALLGLLPNFMNLCFEGEDSLLQAETERPRAIGSP